MSKAMKKRKPSNRPVAKQKKQGKGQNTLATKPLKGIKGQLCSLILMLSLVFFLSFKVWLPNQMSGQLYVSLGRVFHKDVSKGDYALAVQSIRETHLQHAEVAIYLVGYQNQGQEAYILLEADKKDSFIKELLQRKDLAEKPVYLAATVVPKYVSGESEVEKQFEDHQLVSVTNQAGIFWDQLVSSRFLSVWRFQNMDVSFLVFAALGIAGINVFFIGRRYFQKRQREQGGSQV